MKHSKLIPVLLITIFAFTLPTTLTAQSFEGVIMFRKYSQIDTILYAYNVKGNKVRIDELGKNGQDIQGTMLVDTKQKTVVALSHERNMYMDREAKPTPEPDNPPQIVKSKNTKIVHGKRCRQWRVKNDKENTQITYWVTTGGNYDFFIPLMNTLGRKDNFATYYMAIPGKDGAFPMLAVERDMKRNERGRLEVVRIEEKKMSDKLFELPANYFKMEN